VAGKAAAAVVAGKVTTTIVAGKAMLVTAREGFGLVATWCMHTVIGAPSKV
jgi:ribosomal protein S5